MQDKNSKKYITNISAFQRASLHNRLTALSTKLSRLPPSAHKNTNSLSARFKPACEYDGFFGSLILSFIAAPAFAGALQNTLCETAASALSGLNNTLVQTIAGEYLKDKNNRHNPEINGSGTFAVTGDQKSLRMIFKRSDFDPFRHERRQIESAMYGLARAYDSLAPHAA